MPLKLSKCSSCGPDFHRDFVAGWQESAFIEPVNLYLNSVFQMHLRVLDLGQIKGLLNSSGQLSQIALLGLLIVAPKIRTIRVVTKKGINNLMPQVQQGGFYGCYWGMELV